MAYNPWAKRPKVREERTRDFTLSDGDTLTLTLRKLGTPQQLQVAELSLTLTERYVTGDSEFVLTKGASGTAPQDFPLVNGERIDQPTETAIQGAATLQIMQEGPKDTLLDADAWLVFQAVEDVSAWVAIQNFAAEVNRIGKPTTPKAADVPNGSGAVTPTSSERSSKSTGSTRKSHTG